LAPGSTPTDATFNLDVIGNDVNKLRVDFGVSGQNVVTFSGLTPTSLLDVDVTDQPGVNSNLMILAGKVNLSAGNGDFIALTSRLTMSVFGALDSGTGDVKLASTLPGGYLNVSSSASPQIKGGQVYLDFQGAIGDAANPLKVQASTSLEAYTNNATASLQAVGTVDLLGLDMGTGIGSLFGTLIGGLILTLILNGMNLMALNANWQPIVTGVIVLLAVWLDMKLRAKTA